MYIGWGQKHDSKMLYTVFMDEIKMQNPTQDDTFTVEFQEFTKKQKMENEKHGLRKNKNNNRFCRPSLAHSYTHTHTHKHTRTYITFVAVTATTTTTMTTTEVWFSAAPVSRPTRTTCFR